MKTKALSTSKFFPSLYCSVCSVFFQSSLICSMKLYIWNSVFYYFVNKGSETIGVCGMFGELAECEAWWIPGVGGFVFSLWGLEDCGVLCWNLGLKEVLCFVLNSLGSGEGGVYAEFLGEGRGGIRDRRSSGKDYTHQEGRAWWRHGGAEHLPAKRTSSIRAAQLSPRARAPALRKINSAAQPWINTDF